MPKSHDLSRLSDLAEAAGLIPADSYFIDAVQCPAAMRYGETGSSVFEAVSAHHAALELSWYIGDEIRRLKGLPRRAV
jgi:hypothetical protein